MASWVVYWDSNGTWISVGTYPSRWAAERGREYLQPYQMEPLNITTMDAFIKSNQWEESNQRLRGSDVTGIFQKTPDCFLPERYLSDKELTSVIDEIGVDKSFKRPKTKKDIYQPMKKNVKDLIKNTGFFGIDQDEADAVTDLKNMVMKDDIKDIIKIHPGLPQDVKKFKDFLEDDKD